MFSVHTNNEKPAFSNSSGLKGGFENLRFRDGLVWTAGLAIKRTLRIVAYCGQDQSQWKSGGGRSWEYKFGKSSCYF